MRIKIIITLMLATAVLACSDEKKGFANKPVLDRVVELPILKIYEAKSDSSARSLAYVVKYRDQEALVHIKSPSVGKKSVGDKIEVLIAHMSAKKGDKLVRYVVFIPIRVKLRT